MKVINQIVDSIMKVGMGISALLVFVLTFANVLCRYVLKAPIAWSTDILRLAFTYTVFWGAAWCVKTHDHLNVDFLLTSIPAKPRRLVELVINVVLCGFFVFLIIYGIQFAQSGLTQTTSYLPIPMTLYYASIPSAGVLMLFYMVQIVFEQIRAIIAGKEEEA